MVDVKTTVATPTQRARAKMERLRQLHTRPGLRVEPANDDMRRLLTHPKVGHFRSEGSIEWPDDTFTRRRLRDGDIKLVDQPEEQTNAKRDEPRPRHQRQQSSAES